MDERFSARIMRQLKRIHLFEFEDLDWFPDGLRRCITRPVTAMHDLDYLLEGLASEQYTWRKGRIAKGTDMFYLLPGSETP